MKKSLARNLFLIGLVVSIVGGVLVGMSFGTTTDSAGVATATISNGAFLAIGGVLAAVGGIFSLVSWIGSLVKTAQLQRWGWFVAVLLLGGLGLLIYVFGGPEAAKAA